MKIKLIGLYGLVGVLGFNILSTSTVSAGTTNPLPIFSKTFPTAEPAIDTCSLIDPVQPGMDGRNPGNGFTEALITIQKSAPLLLNIPQFWNCDIQDAGGSGRAISFRSDGQISPFGSIVLESSANQVDGSDNFCGMWIYATAPAGAGQKCSAAHVAMAHTYSYKYLFGSSQTGTVAILVQTRRGQSLRGGVGLVAKTPTTEVLIGTY